MIITPTQGVGVILGDRLHLAGWPSAVSVSPSVASLPPPRGVTDHITVLPACLEFLTVHNGLDLI